MTNAMLAIENIMENPKTHSLCYFERRQTMEKGSEKYARRSGAEQQMIKDMATMRKKGGRRARQDVRELSDRPATRGTSSGGNGSCGLQP